MAFVSYANAISSLMYVIVCTIPNIAQVEGILSWFMANPGCEHLAMMNRVFTDLRGTSEYSIRYHSDVWRDQHLINLQGYGDFNWVGDVYRRISTNKYMF